MVKPSFSEVKLSDDKRDLSFVLHGTSLPVANGIVRALQADVETVAFDVEPYDETQLQVVANTGGLNDHMLLSRLGQVPIHFDPVEVDAFARENYVFVLRAACPRDRVGGTLDVTSRDIRVLDADGRDLGARVADRLFPVDPVTGDGVLLARLRPGEEVHVKGPATRASGRRHACFCPVSRVGLSHVRDAAAVRRDAAAIKDAVAREAFLALGADRVTERDADGEPCVFRIVLRSECGLPPKELVRRALMRLRERVGGAAKAVADGEVPQVASEGGLTELCFEAGQDSTLGEIMQYHCCAALRAAGKKDAFVGYDTPHPLSERMLFRMPAERAAEVFQAAADAAVKEITAVMHALPA